MADIKKLQEERTQLFKDLFDGKIPKRVPISVNFPLEFSIQYAGKENSRGKFTLRGKKFYNEFQWIFAASGSERP